jgi:hypothetical protein
MAFITGAFNAFYGGLPLGVTEDGFEQTTSRIQEDIVCDQYRGPLDSVFQGIRMQVRMVLMELNLPGVRRLLWPYDHDLDGEFDDGHGRVGPVGSLLSASALPLTLVPCPGTSAQLLGHPETGGPITSLTYLQAVVSADPQSVKFSSSVRKLPVTLDILPVTCPLPDLEVDSAGPTCTGNLRYYAFNWGDGGPSPLC